jgi:hypothetical protein
MTDVRPGLTGFVAVNSIVTIVIIIALTFALFKLYVLKATIPSLKDKYERENFTNRSFSFRWISSKVSVDSNNNINANEVRNVVLEYIEYFQIVPWIIIGVMVVLFCLLLWQTVGMARVNNMKCKPLNQDIIKNLSTYNTTANNSQQPTFTTANNARNNYF